MVSNTRGKRGHPKPIIKERPPRKASGNQGKWLDILSPIMKAPYRAKWCLIMEFDSAISATSAQKNLSQRKVIIPEPDHDWSFSARDNELYGIYRGPFSKRKR